MEGMTRNQAVPADTTVGELLAELRRREQKALPVSKDTGLAALDTSTLVDAVLTQHKVIYGVDDRQDLFDVSDQAVRRDADALVALMRDTHVQDNGDGTSTISTLHFADAENLCPEERFVDQPVAAFCSGVLVAPDVVATAGHCLDETTVSSTRFVFGFRMMSATSAPSRLPNRDIYRGVALVGRALTGNGADWALVRLDRPVSDHVIAPIRRDGRIADGQQVHVIGHPSGLPTKFAPGATVRDNSPADFFVANLDSYGGNSGSPVFNSVTHEVEGLLVRGETDFIDSGGCRVLLVCPTSGCRGEDVTRATVFAPLLDGVVEPLLRAGSRGAEVAEWQRQLNQVQRIRTWRSTASSVKPRSAPPDSSSVPRACRLTAWSGLAPERPWPLSLPHRRQPRPVSSTTSSSTPLEPFWAA